MHGMHPPTDVFYYSVPCRRTASTTTTDPIQTNPRTHPFLVYDKRVRRARVARGCPKTRARCAIHENHHDHHREGGRRQGRQHTLKTSNLHSTVHIINQREPWRTVRCRWLTFDPRNMLHACSVPPPQLLQTHFSFSHPLCPPSAVVFTGFTHKNRPKSMSSARLL